MRFSFNYYKKLDDVEFYLCNPDGRELFPIVAKERNVTLRFNDLSVIEFQVPAKLEKSDGTIIEKAEYYDYIETMRLIYATKIGWFKITSVIENDAGTEKSKSVQAESLQSVFKNKGFVSEERVYKFYNPRDPYDATYVSSSESAIPSVVGQMYQQLGIKIDINQGLDEPETPYEDWTLTYVNPSLIYEGSGSICRTLKDRTAFGYEWMVNDVEDAFKVVFVFDFYNKAIQVKTVAEITERANLCLSFHNFMKNIQVSESADDIVTVLSCNGNGVDITQVNPTGTNYIVDFSYYMDVVNHRWMSTELINKINVWKVEVEAAKPSYVSLVTQLKSLYLERTEYEAEQKERNVAYENLLEANAKYSASLGAGSALSGIVAAETVGISDRATILGEDAKAMSSEVTTSLDSSSAFNKNSFASTKSLTCYTEAPEYDEATGTWYFTGTGRTASATDNYNTQDPTSLLSYVYFIDGDGKSYCKLSGSVKLDADGDEYKSSYYCDGFVRYVAYSLATTWLTLHKNKLDLIQASIDTLDVSIGAKTKSLNEISSKLNILSYFSSTPNLLRELNCYWIEGDYTDDNISASDEATTDELIDLANELLDSGEIELSKVSQPRFSFSLEAANFMHQYEFRSQLFELQLGKIITVEKEEGLWYYPALLELSFSLDNADDFSMTFANSLRLDDWGYTYADLIADASSTARQVSANWKELMSYAKERENIDSLIKNPLDTTLRAAYANMSNQEFVINDMGILGRKAATDGSGDFDKEQVRLINNLILFTDDNWETIKTALGKIYYTDSTGQDRVEYGLIGETIIGRLLMGEKLEILNQNSTVKIDGSGIIIKKPIYDEDGVLSEYQTMFEANADTGKLYVLEAEITGNIKGGTVNISNNFLVDKDGNVTIKKGSININDNFIVDDDGNVQLNGSIVWGTGNSPTQIVYANTAFVKPSDGTKWSSFPEANSSGWHRKYVASDYFASYTYDGGNTWTDAIQIAGINGQDGQDGVNGSNGADGADGANGADGSDASVTTINMFNAVTENGTKQGCFVLDNGALAINAAYIKGGQIDANLILAGNVVANDLDVVSGTFTGSIVATNDINSSNKTLINETGIYFGNPFNTDSPSYIGSSEYAITYSDGSCYMTCIDIYRAQTITVVRDGWYSGLWYQHGWTITPDSISLRASYQGGDGTTITKNGTITASDRNVKNNIGVFSDKYEILFDHLIPRIYGYNSDIEDQVHSGFVAQEVDDAICIAGLTRKEFAALCVECDKETEKEKWGLMYDEFISLNTWQIQKLKTRVAELEQLVRQLQERN